MISTKTETLKMQTNT